MKSYMHIGVISLAMLGMSCTAMDRPVSNPDGNARLGIAKFQISQTPSSIKIVGVDDAGAQVATLDAQRGPYTMVDENGHDVDVDGRRYQVEVRGHTGSYQGNGYTTLNLPSPPEEVSVLVHDPHVEPILASWGINFQKPTASGETTPPKGEVAYSLLGYGGNYGAVYGESYTTTSPQTADYVCDSYDYYGGCNDYVVADTHPPMIMYTLVAPTRAVRCARARAPS